MYKLGTDYGGWIIPNNILLNQNSIIYGGGVGEDISFDLLLQDKYDCTIILIDPTKRALTHYQEIQDYYSHKYRDGCNNSNNNLENMKTESSHSFSGDIQKDYLPIINSLNPNFAKFKYYNMGLWNCQTELKFYHQTNPKYVSQSFINNMFGSEYNIVKTTTIKDIMAENEHNRIDLLKLDIEGAEIEVLNNMLDDRIFPKYLCVEFDLYLKQKDTQNKTQNVVDRLLSNNYKCLVNDNLNITFEYTL